MFVAVILHNFAILNANHALCLFGNADVVGN